MRGQKAPSAPKKDTVEPEQATFFVLEQNRPAAINASTIEGLKVLNFHKVRDKNKNY